MPKEGYEARDISLRSPHLARRARHVNSHSKHLHDVQCLHAQLAVLIPRDVEAGLHAREIRLAHKVAQNLKCRHHALAKIVGDVLVGFTLDDFERLGHAPSFFFRHWAVLLATEAEVFPIYGPAISSASRIAATAC